MDKSQIRFFEKAASEGFKGLEIKREKAGGSDAFIHCNTI
jgi:hypothetical protein